MGRVGVSPYTDDDEAVTTFPTLASLASMRTFRVPSIFTSFVDNGSLTDRATEGSAAR